MKAVGIFGNDTITITVEYSRVENGKIAMQMLTVRPFC